MLSIIEVVCPHCGAHGQIMLPPVGTIIIGPCPECQGLVVVFCGNVLALDKEIMLKGTVPEKQGHLLTVLTDFLKERVAQMISGEEISASADSSQTDSIGQVENHARPQNPPPSKSTPITRGEFTTFANVELELLDNKDYFRAIFG